MNNRPPQLRVIRSLRSRKQQLVEALRNAIFEQRFAPGDRLIERELCEMFDVSRTLLREVLSQLEAEGIVRIILHRGPMVAVYSADEAAAIYELRATLEEMAGRLFVERASAAERKGLNEAYAELKRSYKHKNGKNHLAVKSKFYAALTGGAHNPMLVEMLRLIHGRVSMLRATTLSQPGRLAVSAAEIGAIVDAINEGDADGAARACRRHVCNAAAIAATLLSVEQKQAARTTTARGEA